VLQIRPEQLQVLQQPRIDAYLAKVLPKLEEDFPDRYEHIGEQGVRKLVCNAIALGEKHGFEFEADITAIASLMLVFGTDLFDRQENEWMRKILQTSSLATEAKLPMIIEQMAAKEDET
jgi:hypothetical protein